MTRQQQITPPTAPCRTLEPSPVPGLHCQSPRQTLQPRGWGRFGGSPKSPRTPVRRAHGVPRPSSKLIVLQDTYRKKTTASWAGLHRSLRTHIVAMHKSKKPKRDASCAAGSPSGEGQIRLCFLLCENVSREKAQKLSTCSTYLQNQKPPPSFKHGVTLSTLVDPAGSLCRSLASTRVPLFQLNGQVGSGNCGRSIFEITPRYLKSPKPLHENSQIKGALNTMHFGCTRGPVQHRQMQDARESRAAEIREPRRGHAVRATEGLKQCTAPRRESTIWSTEGAQCTGSGRKPRSLLHLRRGQNRQGFSRGIACCEKVPKVPSIDQLDKKRNDWPGM